MPEQSINALASLDPSLVCRGVPPWAPHSELCEDQSGGLLTGQPILSFAKWDGGLLTGQLILSFAKINRGLLTGQPHSELCEDQSGGLLTGQPILSFAKWDGVPTEGRPQQVPEPSESGALHFHS
jgi:hypothetical protein